MANSPSPLEQFNTSLRAFSQNLGSVKDHRKADVLALIEGVILDAQNFLNQHPDEIDQQQFKICLTLWVLDVCHANGYSKDDGYPLGIFEQALEKDLQAYGEDGSKFIISWYQQNIATLNSSLGLGHAQ